MAQSTPRVGKAVPLKAANDPAQQTFAAGKPAVPPTLSGNVPRGTDSLADGQTLGNFKKLDGSMAAPNPGPTAAQDVADEVSEEFAK